MQRTVSTFTSGRFVATCRANIKKGFRLQTARAATASPPQPSREVPRLDKKLDDELSNRHLELDPSGYFIIYVDRATKEIVADHYTNVINKNGIACDPDTNKPIPCTPGYRRLPKKSYRARSAKELQVSMIEKETPPPLSMLDHACYLGREFQRAEQALISGEQYIQD